MAQSTSNDSSLNGNKAETESETPRTAAAWTEEWETHRLSGGRSNPAYGMCDLAGQLERELAEANARIYEQKRTLDVLHDTCEGYEKRIAEHQALEAGALSADAGGPDFNTETNLHADTVAERYDAARESGISSATTERDAARWRKFNEVAKRHFNYDMGSLTFYLPRSGGGFKGFEETIDEYNDPVGVQGSKS